MGLLWGNLFAADAQQRFSQKRCIEAFSNFACLREDRAKRTGTSVGLRRLFSSIRSALTLHGTKSNSVLSLRRNWRAKLWD